jgi:hypothetical protein
MDHRLHLLSIYFPTKNPKIDHLSESMYGIRTSERFILFELQGEADSKPPLVLDVI